MARKAHNSTWTDGLLYGGVQYAGPKALHDAADPLRRVKLITFGGRLRQRRSAGDLVDEALLAECLYTSPADYQGERGPRRTWVRMDGGQRDAAVLYSGSEQSVSYSTFRQRLVRLERGGLLDEVSLNHAASLSQAEWISFYGGGRRQTFVYDGEDYPAHAGESFSSVSAFLRTIDRYEDRGNVWDRLKQHWPIDTALSEPVRPATERSGVIYKVTQTSTGMVYVGLTISSLTVRWSQHRINAGQGASTALARAIQADGPDGFAIEAVEDGLDLESLGERERYWIGVFDCVAPRGLNSSSGGQIGGGRRKPVVIDGESFPSREEAYHVIAKRRGLPTHVVATRYRAGRPLTEKARSQSKHQEAGTNLWRRWLSLLNGVRRGVRQGPIDPSWIASYDAFAKDVRPTYDENLEMVRIDETKAWGPGNFTWTTRGQRVAQSHGASLTAGGVAYDSIQALAKASGIGTSTLKYRLGKGMSPDEAIVAPLGPTSRKGREPIVFEGVPYPSLNAAAKHAADRYGMSFDLARDRLRRGKGFGDASAPPGGMRAGRFSVKEAQRRHGS